MNPPAPSPDCIGVFDSGVGGLSILRALRERLPGTAIRYVADNAHAPYGERDADFVIERSLRITGHLVAQGARLVVVACNTATALAIERLRLHWPLVPFIGVEPAVKPAAAATLNGRIGVMATTRTLASARMAALVERHANGAAIHLQPCPGLATAIEHGSAEPLSRLIEQHCTPLVAAGVDTVVLGCTHYPFAADGIQSFLGPQVRLIDSAQAVAARAASLWSHACTAGSLHLAASGDAESLAGFAERRLGIAAIGQRIDC